MLTSTKKRALICGVSGQDGAYLAQLLINKNYEVFGSSRDAKNSSFSNLKRLSVFDAVRKETILPSERDSVIEALIRIQPTEIYNLSGQSSVGVSFEEPIATIESIATCTLNFLEAMRISGIKARFYSAGSGEIFGDTGGHAADESSQFLPRSPYAVAKATAFWHVAMYREAYDLWAYTGILFNHESPLRPERFVTKKIVAAAVRIANGSNETLELGNLHICRDWGWAPEYVDAMWRMLQHENPEDYVIATGSTSSLAEFLACVFSLCGLDWREHVQIINSLTRRLDIRESRANPGKAMKNLGWAAQYHMNAVAKSMIAEEPGRAYISAGLPE